MTITKADAHWRVDRVTSDKFLLGQKPRNIPVAWFMRRWQAEQYVLRFANDPLNTKFSYLIIDEDEPSNPYSGDDVPSQWPA